MAKKSAQILGHSDELSKEVLWGRRKITLKREEGEPGWTGEQQCVGLGAGWSGGVAEIFKGQGEEIRLDAGGRRERPQYLYQKIIGLE